MENTRESADNWLTPFSGHAHARRRSRPGCSRDDISDNLYDVSRFVTSDYRPAVYLGAEHGYGEHLCRVDYPGYVQRVWDISAAPVSPWNP